MDDVIAVGEAARDEATWQLEHTFGLKKGSDFVVFNLGSDDKNSAIWENNGGKQNLFLIVPNARLGLNSAYVNASVVNYKEADPAVRKMWAAFVSIRINAFVGEIPESRVKENAPDGHPWPGSFHNRVNKGPTDQFYIGSMLGSFDDFLSPEQQKTIRIVHEMLGLNTNALQFGIDDYAGNLDREDRKSFFTEEETATIAMELDAVRKAVNRVLVDLQAPDETTKARLARWFGGPVSDEDLKIITKVFRYVQDGLDGKDTTHPKPRFKNVRGYIDNDEYTIADTDPNPQVLLVLPSGGQTRLSRVFWELTPRRQAMALFHEMTHLFAVTGDYGYVVPTTLDRDSNDAALRPNGPKYKIKETPRNPTKAELLKNADTYAGFLADYYLDDLSN